jgi:glycosyltransferase involved in cell wall biosynthesis
LKVVVITHNYIRRRDDLTALYLHRLSSGLVERGMDIVVVCPHAPGLLREEEIDGVRIKRFAYPLAGVKQIAYMGNMHEEVGRSVVAKLIFLDFLRSFYRTGLRVCCDEKADLIWANWWIPPGLAAARIGAKLRVPVVISSHGTDIMLLGRSGILSPLSRYVYKRTAKATVVSSYLREKLLVHVDVIAPADVVVIPMPVGMENFPKTPPPDNKTPILLSVARYMRQKRLDDIIAAAERIAGESIDFTMRMVGEGPLESELKESVRAKGLDGRIEFMPLMDQQRLGELYRQADAVVLASEGEGFGLVLVEAGLTGRPVIAARSGGITDIVEDGYNGLMFDVGDVTALTECVKTLFADRSLRARLGENGYTRAMERFSTPVLVDRMHDLFASLIESGPREI